jgi:membrane-associated protease RseP (regulator of RpoE activity)
MIVGGEGMRALVAVLVTMLVAACATPTTQRAEVSDEATKAEATRQMEIAVGEMVEEQKRISRIYRTLAIRAHAMCGELVGPEVGLFSMSRPQGQVGTVYEEKFGIGPRRTVLFVLEGSPAEAAGIKARDVIRSINGVHMSNKEGLVQLYEKIGTDDPLFYEVERSGENLSFTIKPERACRFPITLSPAQIINAFADGKQILVTRGMVNFARSDDELALVIAHEMAHNIMKHMEARRQNMGVGLLADIAVVLLSRGQVRNTNFAGLAATAYSKEFEAEADYVGLYIMAQAGMPIADAPKFWRRMAAAHPANIRTNHSATHPSTAYRMVALEETVKEIDDKRVKGGALVPNMVDGKFKAPTQ